MTLHFSQKQRGRPPAFGRTSIVAGAPPSQGLRQACILDVVMKCDGLDIEGAKVRAAEAINRPDLIKTKGGGKGGQRMDATSLLNPQAGSADASLPAAYLGHRLGVEPADVLMPSTAAVGWAALTYWEAPTKPGGKPVDVGQFPAVAFSTVAADGGLHCHRIYVAPGGAGKADLGIGPNGKARDPKKSAKAPVDGASTAGRSVLWGDVRKAPHVIVTEGIESRGGPGQDQRRGPAPRWARGRRCHYPRRPSLSDPFRRWRLRAGVWPPAGGNGRQ